MAERSKALRSGRSLVLQAWVRIPLLTKSFHEEYTMIAASTATLTGTAEMHILEAVFKSECKCSLILRCF